MWFASCVAAARASGKKVFDTVFNNYAHIDLFRTACRSAVLLGADGKLLIHPSQIAVCNEEFTPTQSDLNRAEAIADIYRKSERSGRAVVGVGGEMIERLHAEIAERTIALSRQYGIRKESQ
jgi:citrate lyase subunit beta/citryl-CoA lyase